MLGTGWGRLEPKRKKTLRGSVFRFVACKAERRRARGFAPQTEHQVIWPRLTGLAQSRLPRGRQARPDLSAAKSGKRDRLKFPPSLAMTQP